MKRWSQGLAQAKHGPSYPGGMHLLIGAGLPFRQQRLATRPPARHVQLPVGPGAIRLLQLQQHQGGRAEQAVPAVREAAPPEHIHRLTQAVEVQQELGQCPAWKFEALGGLGLNFRL